METTSAKAEADEAEPKEEVLEAEEGVGPSPSMMKLGKRSKSIMEIAVNKHTPQIFKYDTSSELYMKNKYGEESWQNTLYEKLTHRSFEIFLLVLLFLDIIVVISEIVVDVEYPSCHNVRRTGIVRSCCPITDDGGYDHGEGHRFLVSSSESSHHSSDNHHSFCDGHGYEELSYYGCNDHNETIHKVHLSLFIVSTTILCIFELELLMKLFLLQPREFFRHKLLALDLVVVTISLTLDILLHSMSSLLGELAVLLAFVRLWRFIRIIHGVFEEIIEHSKEQFEEFEEEFDKEILEKDKEIEKLKNELKLLNASD